MLSVDLTKLIKVILLCQFKNVFSTDELKLYFKEKIERKSIYFGKRFGTKIRRINACTLLSTSDSSDIFRNAPQL